MKKKYYECWVAMLLKNKTLQALGIDVDTLTISSTKKVWFECNTCQKQSIKPYRDCIAGTGLCISCSRYSNGLQLGNKHGKSQKLQGVCKSCGVAIASTLKYCKNVACTIQKEKNISAMRSGSNNPAWTGTNVCGCGVKKSTNAINCRSCSFKDGKRSGSNNGRYISHNREQYLQDIKIKKIMSSNMSNVCKSGKLIKNYRKTKDLLNYTWKDFKCHIEQQFQDGMSWDNYNKWHIDHKVPVSWYIKNNTFNIKTVNALSNLRPLWAKDNLKKGNKPMLYLIAGVSGSGKSWVCNQLSKQFNYISYDAVPKKQHLTLLLNPKNHNKPLLYDLSIKTSTFIKRHSKEFDIHFITIMGDFLQVKQQLKNRGGKITKGLYRRWIIMKNRTDQYAEFTGSASEVLSYLQSVGRK